MASTSSNSDSNSTSSETSSSGKSSSSSSNGFSLGSSYTAGSNTDEGAPSETSAAHSAGIEGPGLANGSFGSSWTSNEGGKYSSGSGGNGSGTWGSYSNDMDFLDKDITSGGAYTNPASLGQTQTFEEVSGTADTPVSYSSADGTYGYYVNTNKGSFNVNESTGVVTTTGGKVVGSFNKNGSFIPNKDANLSSDVIDAISKDYTYYQDKYNEAMKSVTGSSLTNKTDKNGSSITDVSNINETPSTKSGTQVMSGVHDSDVESSTTSGGSANGNIPTESGYNNDKAKNEVEQQFKNIDADTDENKTNYNKDTFNYGMKDVSTDAVSDERCKKFVSNCIRHEPFARKGVKKIVEIIRSK